MSKKVNPQPPEELTGIKSDKPKKVAAGIPAVVSSLKHIREAMPIGRGLKTLGKLNQEGGVDCPGCAWPDPDPKERSSIAEYCENGAKAIAEEATTKKIKPDFFKKYDIATLSEKSDYWLGKSGRITQPFILKEGQNHYEPIEWEDAFTLIAKELKALSSPDDAIFYTSGRTSNEAAFLYQLFARHFGTNNLPDCSNMCHESSGVALSQTLGIGKGSVKLEDFYAAEVIIVMGQNPGTNHPRMLSALQKAKRKGAKIITVNPIKETGLLAFKNPQKVGDVLSSGTSLTDLYLQVKINGDIALLKAIMLLLNEKEQATKDIFDKAFIEKNTVGYQAFIKDLSQYNIDELVEESGISLAQIKEAVSLLEKSSKIIVCWAMGITQHKNGVANIKEIVNLLLLKGSVGKVGAGTCPVRGHSNVQGDRTMGIWEKPKEAFLAQLQATFGFDPPRHHGVNVVDAIKVMHDQQDKVFFAMGGNFLSAAPDTEYTAKALQNCRMTVHVSTKLNRSHLIHGKVALILPCLARTEVDKQANGKQFVSVENSMGIVHTSRGHLKPISKHLLSEPMIVACLAQKTLGEASKVDWLKLVENYDAIRDLIEQVIPGFENYNKRVRQTGGFYLPNCARDGDFKTLSGKAEFTVTDLPKHSLEADDFLMMTIRSHDQFNTTIYGLDDRYRGIYNERRVVLMNQEDMKRMNLKSKDIVHLYNYFEGVERVARTFVVVPYDIPKQCVATYFPEANPLVPINKVADKSHTPASKSVVIKIKK